MKKFTQIMVALILLSSTIIQVYSQDYLVEASYYIGNKTFCTRVTSNGSLYKTEISTNASFDSASTKKFPCGKEVGLETYYKMFCSTIYELDTSIKVNNNEAKMAGLNLFYKIKSRDVEDSDGPIAATFEIAKSSLIPMYNVKDKIAVIKVDKVKFNMTVIGKKVVHNSKKLHWKYPELYKEMNNVNFNSSNKDIITTSSKGALKVCSISRYKLLDSDQRSIIGSIPSDSIKSVNIEFKEGYMEHIDVLIRMNDRDYVFTNYKPIGISTMNNIIQFNTIYLYEPSDTYCIKLSDIITKYERKHQVGRRDYSPENKIISSTSGSIETIRKAKTKELFMGKIYTDIVGFDTQNPNGLVQTEISKRININTYRYSFASTRKHVNHGWVQFIEPQFVVSKIEDNNRYLLLNQRNDIVNGQLITNKYTQTLQLYRYQTLNAGFRLNFFVLDLPPMKSSIYINVGANYIMTAFRDSSVTLSATGTITKTGNTNTFMASNLIVWPELKCTIEPDERYGFDFTVRASYIWLLNNEVTQVNRMNLFELTGKDNFNNWIFTACLDAYIKPSQNLNSQLFVRLAFNSAMDDFNKNFFQAQIGYGFYLIGRTK